MSDSERRIAPRKICAVPVRFRVLREEYVTATAHAPGTVGGPTPMDTRPVIRGEARNLSERGIGFKSPLKFKVGQTLEMFLTIPGELTGRYPEEVRCTARVVYVENFQDLESMTGVGAEVEGFESLHLARAWPN